MSDQIVDEAEAKPENPLRVDPRGAESGRDLSSRVHKIIDDLEWRVIARDNQARAIEMLSDLGRPAEALVAERQTKEERRAQTPDGPAAAQILARILGKCEAAMDDLLEHGDGDRSKPGQKFLLAARFAAAAPRLAITMAQLEAASTRESGE